MLNKIKETIGALLVFIGIIICMCDVYDFTAQVMTLFVGFLMVFTGAVMIWCAESLEEQEQW